MASRSDGGASFGRPTGSLRSRRSLSTGRDYSPPAPKSVTHVPGLICYPCLRPYKGRTPQRARSCRG
jgi:hypothetical protein